MKRTELLVGAVAVAAMCAVSNPSRADARKGGTQEMRLERLFDVRLQYAESVEGAPLGEREGRLIGGGTGTVDGAKIKGQVVRWSNFERALAAGLCVLQMPAEIRTDDGAEINRGLEQLERLEGGFGSIVGAPDFRPDQGAGSK